MCFRCCWSTNIPSSLLNYVQRYWEVQMAFGLKPVVTSVQSLIGQTSLRLPLLCFQSSRDVGPRKTCFYFIVSIFIIFVCLLSFIAFGSWQWRACLEYVSIGRWTNARCFTAREPVALHCRHPARIILSIKFFTELVKKPLNNKMRYALEFGSCLR